MTRPRPQRAPARSGVAIQVNLTLASGSLPTGSAAGRTLAKKGDGSMYSQAYVRVRRNAWRGLARA